MRPRRYSAGKEMFKRESSLQRSQQWDRMKLPPLPERVFSGVMVKKSMTARGIKWTRRYAVLTSEYLAFVKPFDAIAGLQNAADDQMHHKAAPAEDQLRAAWKAYEVSGDGLLQKDELEQALIDLNLYSSKSDFDNLFTLLDCDSSGALSWDEFKILAARSAATNQIVDYIPLDEIETIDVEVHPIESTKDDLIKPSSQAKDSALRYKDAQEPSAQSKTSVFASLLSMVERAVGIDFDGDGQVDTKEIPPCDPKSEEVLLLLTTMENGHNSGKTYVHALPWDQAQDWVSRLTQAVNLAQAFQHREYMSAIYGHSPLSMLRAKTRFMYDSNAFQITVGIFICLGFLIDIAESQVMAESGGYEDQVFYTLDCIITGIYTLELAINFFAHSDDGARAFIARTANWFDCFIVVCSLTNVILQSTGTELPNAKMLRLLRVGRVVRLFSSLKDLQRVLAAVASAILPVCNAFLVLVVVSAIYAIIGANWFHNEAPEFFENFHTALFTMFQVLSGDSWASMIARSLFERMGEADATHVKTRPDIAFFFVSYVLLVSMMLLNVVVAVLLDEFIAHVGREKEESERQEMLERDKRKLRGPLDPLTETLLSFEDEDALEAKIADIYGLLDEDESGGLNFEEFRDGVKRLSDKIHLTQDDFDIITENGKHLGPTAEFNSVQFQDMMKGELWRYSRRELANVLEVSGDEQFRSTILMLKLFETSTRAQLREMALMMHARTHHLPPLRHSQGGRGGEGHGAGTAHAQRDANTKTPDADCDEVNEDKVEAMQREIQMLQQEVSAQSEKLDGHTHILEAQSDQLAEISAAIENVGYFWKLTLGGALDGRDEHSTPHFTSSMPSMSADGTGAAFLQTNFPQKETQSGRRTHRQSGRHARRQEASSLEPSKTAEDIERYRRICQRQSDVVMIEASSSRSTTDLSAVRAARNPASSAQRQRARDRAPKYRDVPQGDARASL